MAQQSASTRPAVRMIDGNAHRAGAGISAVALLVAFAVQWRPIAPVMLAVMTIGPVFGLRYSPLGAAYRAAKRLFRLDIAVDPEPEAPPRFAQVVGMAFTALATVAFVALDNAALGWGSILAMAAAQGLLAASGICLGCEVYVLAQRRRGAAA